MIRLGSGNGKVPRIRIGRGRIITDRQVSIVEWIDELINGCPAGFPVGIKACAG